MRRDLTAYLGQTITVKIDRPLGSVHPRYPDLVYPVNYGYLPGVLGGDGEEQDVYVLGIDRPLREFTGTVVAIVHRTDDEEDKLVAAPAGRRFCQDEIEAALCFQEQYFAHTIYHLPSN